MRSHLRMFLLVLTLLSLGQAAQAQRDEVADFIGLDSVAANRLAMRRNLALVETYTDSAMMRIFSGPTRLYQTNPDALSNYGVQLTFHKNRCLSVIYTNYAGLEKPAKLREQEASATIQQLLKSSRYRMKTNFHANKSYFFDVLKHPLYKKCSCLGMVTRYDDIAEGGVKGLIFTYYGEREGYDLLRTRLIKRQIDTTAAHK